MVDATSSEVSVKLRELAVAIRSAGDPVSQSPTLIHVHIKLTASETRRNTTQNFQLSRPNQVMP